MSLLFNIISKSQICCKRLAFSAFVKNYSASRIFSSKATTVVKENSEHESEKTYKEIYRFSYIRLGHAINTFKWPQTLLTGFIFPNTAALYFGGIIELDCLMAVFISGAVITGNVYAYGSLFTEAVGFMYLSEDGSTIKISYLDFWGARVNKEFPVDDIMPLADCPRSLLDYMHRTIYLYSTDKLKLKLYFRPGGKITDEDKFVRVFGDYTKY